MPFLAAITQPSWLRVLRKHGALGEVNFWRPGRQALAPMHYGCPLVFVQKGSNPRRVPGCGTIVRYEQMSIAEAWARWGVRNGVETEDEFVVRLAAVARSTSTNSGGLKHPFQGRDTLIGCIVLREVSILPEEGAPTLDIVLPGFHDNVVHYKRFEGDLPRPLKGIHSLAATSEAVIPRGSEQSNQQLKDCVEEHAVSIAHAVFRGWQLLDVSTPEGALRVLPTAHPGYDLLARQGAKELHVEIKGTTTNPPVITITRNELQAAAVDDDARLFVVGSVTIVGGTNPPTAVGGQPTLYRWRSRASVQRILDGAQLGVEHSLTPKAPEWSLHVSATDLLELEDDLSTAP